jgi:hypothetical protein
MFEVALSTVLPNFHNLSAPGDIVPSRPFVNSPRVASTFGAPENTNVVYRGPPMMGPSGRRAPLLRSFGKGLQGNPLEALSNLLSADYMKGPRILSPTIDGHSHP